MDTLKYFIAICEETRNGYTVYPQYFVNNSHEEIESLVIVRPGAFDMIKSKEKIEDIKDDMIDGSIFIRKYLGVPAESYILEDVYRDWDFDWENERIIWIKAQGKEEHLHFYIEKYFITNQIEFIPVLNKNGWLCNSR